MIKVLAIDDEPLALQQLAAYIKKVPFLQLMGECQSATEAKEILNRETIDAIFCDINMPDLNGMDFVKSLAAPPLIVFTTAYSEYAVEGFKVNAVDYLLKPFGLDDFRRAANRLQERLATPAAPESVPEMHAQADEERVRAARRQRQRRRLVCEVICERFCAVPCRTRREAVLLVLKVGYGHTTIGIRRTDPLRVASIVRIWSLAELEGIAKRLGGVAGCVKECLNG